MMFNVTSVSSGRLWLKTRWLTRKCSETWISKRVAGLSAEIAFFAILGLFPLVIVFASFLGFLDSGISQDTTTTIERWMTDWVDDVFGSDNTLRTIISDLFNRSGAVSMTLGILMSLYAASRGFSAMVRSLNVIYESRRRQNWVASRVLGFVVMMFTLLVAVILAALAVVGPLLMNTLDGWIKYLNTSWVFDFLWSWIRWPLVFVTVTIWMASLYRFVPRHRVSWKYQIPGAVVGTVWWLTVSAGFRFYLEYASGGVNVVLGVLGGALSLLLWLYMLAMGLLVGAVFNSTLLAYGNEQSTD